MGIVALAVLGQDHLAAKETHLQEEYDQLLPEFIIKAATTPLTTDDESCREEWDSPTHKYLLICL